MPSLPTRDDPNVSGLGLLLGLAMAQLATRVSSHLSLQAPNPKQSPVALAPRLGPHGNISPKSPKAPSVLPISTQIPLQQRYLSLLPQAMGCNPLFLLLPRQVPNSTRIQGAGMVPRGPLTLGNFPWNPCHPFPQFTISVSILSPTS